MKNRANYSTDVLRDITYNKKEKEHKKHKNQKKHTKHKQNVRIWYVGESLEVRKKGLNNPSPPPSCKIRPFTVGGSTARTRWKELIS